MEKKPLNTDDTDLTDLRGFLKKIRGISVFRVIRVQKWDFESNLRHDFLLSRTSKTNSKLK